MALPEKAWVPGRASGLDLWLRGWGRAPRVNTVRASRGVAGGSSMSVWGPGTGASGRVDADWGPDALPVGQGRGWLVVLDGQLPAPAGQAVWPGSGLGAGGALPSTALGLAGAARGRGAGGAVWSGASSSALSLGCSRPVLFLHSSVCGEQGGGRAPAPCPRLALPAVFSSYMDGHGRWVALGTEHRTGEVHAGRNHVGLREPGTSHPRDMQAGGPADPRRRGPRPDEAQRAEATAGRGAAWSALRTGAMHCGLAVGTVQTPTDTDTNTDTRAHWVPTQYGPAFRGAGAPGGRDGGHLPLREAVLPLRRGQGPRKTCQPLAVLSPGALRRATPRCTKSRGPL